MKRLTKNRIQLGLLTASVVAVIGCARELSEDAVVPTFPATADVFTDDFIGLGADFYFPFADAKPDVFSVDMNEGFESNSSIRIDVPSADDPGGSYAGAIFRAEGPRDLSGFDALSFYVKASQGVSLGSAGFGVDYRGDIFRVAANDIIINTGWKQVIIPIPDPSKLTQEDGLFWFATGSQGTGGLGYTVWFDEIRFIKTGITGVPTSQMLGGETRTVETFVGSSIAISDLQQVYNLATGSDLVLATAPAYYEFVSSDTSVATVDANGLVSIVGQGNAEITATVAGKAVLGKLQIQSKGDLPAAPTPIHPQSDVLSIFSDSYTNATESDFTPGFGGSTTQTTTLSTSSGDVLQYASNNFTGIIFENDLNGSAMTHLHIDAYVDNAATTIGIEIRDIGPNKTLETNIFNGFPEGDDKDYRTNLGGIQSGSWRSFDIPLSGDLTNQKGNLGALIITDGPDFILDNIYFYKQ